MERARRPRPSRTGWPRRPHRPGWSYRPDRPIGPVGPVGPAAPIVDHTVWLSPLDATTEKPGLLLERGFFGATLRVTASAPGDLQWVDFPLTLPSDRKIKRVTVCYSVTDPASVAT